MTGFQIVITVLFLVLASLVFGLGTVLWTAKENYRLWKKAKRDAIAKATGEQS